MKILHKAMAAALGLLLSLSCHALTAEQAFAMAAAEDNDARAAAINAAALEPDEGGRLAAYLQALADDAVRTAGGKAYVIQGERTIDPATGTAATLPADAEEIVNNNYLRGVIESAQAALALTRPDVQARRAAAKKLAEEPDAARLP